MNHLNFGDLKRLIVSGAVNLLHRWVTGEVSWQRLRWSAVSAVSVIYFWWSSDNCWSHPPSRSVMYSAAKLSKRNGLITIGCDTEYLACTEPLRRVGLSAAAETLVHQPTRLSTNGMSHPAFTPKPRRAPPHFGWYSFPVPSRVGGWVGLSGFLHPEVVCRPKTKRLKFVVYGFYMIGCPIFPRRFLFIISCPKHGSCTRPSLIDLSAKPIVSGMFFLNSCYLWFNLCCNDRCKRFVHCLQVNQYRRWLAASWQEVRK